MLKLSDNRRFLVHDDGTPFFYLGDTAWELFHRCTIEEAEHYLRDRAAKGFTVIQAVALAELDGLHEPNMRGDTPLIDDDPARPNEAYFRHVDAVVDMAASLGLYVGMLPTWGDKWNKHWGVGPEIFMPENARAYGLFLGRRYAERPIIWILGGDRPVETDEQRTMLRAMAAGLREGDGGRHLMGFHTYGPHSSSEFVHDETWLDLHMCQSGHARNSATYRFIEQDYALTPTRPVMDAEPGYEECRMGCTRWTAATWTTTRRARRCTGRCSPGRTATPTAATRCGRCGGWGDGRSSAPGGRGRRRCSSPAPGRCATRAPCCSRGHS
jgi:hypothetical protein